ncbi:MAG: tyrosine-type recombinase/integrase [Lachnospiraceae bacterium]|nr:tyrosine-type recombinase/integrase [Lachnospiraceae bacterium]
MSRTGENIFRRKDGRWEARYIHHYEAGKAKYRYLYGATYEEVKEKRDMERAKLKQQESLVTNDNEKFLYLANLWLLDRKMNVKESTYTRYHRIVSKYLAPQLGECHVTKLDSKTVSDLTVFLLEKGGTLGEGLSPKTVTDILCVLKAILRYGYENGVSCQVIGKIRYPQRKKRVVKTLEDEKRIKMEQCLLSSEDTVSLGILLSLFTGIRIGELCGLRWSDIDFANSTLNICRTVERIADLNPHTPNRTKVIIGEPKTESSVRTIPLPAFLAKHLEKHRCSGDCYILTGTTHPTEPHQYYVRYRKYLIKNAIGSYSFHTLRHTFATRCVEMGFDTKSLSEILGHSGITTTLSVYVHPSMQQKRAQMERLTPKNAV